MSEIIKISIDLKIVLAILYSGLFLFIVKKTTIRPQHSTLCVYFIKLKPLKYSV